MRWPRARREGEGTEGSEGNQCTGKGRLVPRVILMVHGSPTLTHLPKGDTLLAEKQHSPASFLSKTKQNATNNIKGNLHKVKSWSFSRNSASQKGVAGHIWNDERENLQPRLFYPAKISFRFDKEIKTFTDKQKLREFSTTKPALQKMLKELL